MGQTVFTLDQLIIALERRGWQVEQSPDYRPLLTLDLSRGEQRIRRVFPESALTFRTQDFLPFLHQFTGEYYCWCLACREPFLQVVKADHGPWGLFYEYRSAKAGLFSPAVSVCPQCGSKLDLGTIDFFADGDSECFF